MELKVKFFKNWFAGVPVAMLDTSTAVKIGVHTQERILIRTLGKNSKQISTIVDIVGKLVGDDEIVVSSEIKKILSLKVGEKVEISLTPAPVSMDYIKKKLNGTILKKEEIYEIVRDIVNNSLSESEIALFVSAMYEKGMNFKETIYLVKAILETGNKLILKSKYVVDKHCIGGVAGNRTTPLVVSICVAGGLIMPKSSSRAITSAAGTADVIEMVANVDVNTKDLKKIISRVGGFMVWGGGLGMVPADSKIIYIEKQLKIDPEAQLLASIMAKKLAMGAKYILIDIPYGRGAKVSRQNALKVKKKFERLGKYFHKKMKVVLTDGSQPIGNGIGPALELIDVVKVLDPNAIGPGDLEDKSVFLAGQIFELSGKVRKGQGEKFAREILKSGKAFKKFNEIVDAQGRVLKRIHLGEFKKDIFVKRTCIIEEIDNKKINNMARVAGCPVDKYSGLYLHKHVGEKLMKGEKILTVYTDSKSRMKHALKFYKKKKPVKFG